MITRGQRAAEAANFATLRLERPARLRGPGGSGCSTHTAGADTLFRGRPGRPINSWTWTTLSNQTWKVSLAVTYQTGPGKTKNRHPVTRSHAFRNPPGIRLVEMVIALVLLAIVDSPLRVFLTNIRAFQVPDPAGGPCSRTCAGPPP